MEQKSTIQKRLTEKEVREIRSPANRTKTRKQLAEQYGVTYYTIKSIQEYITWRDLD